jgi:hypothetical protein
MTVEFSFVATPDLGLKAMRYILWRRAGLLGPLAVILLPVLLAFVASDPAWRPAAYLIGGAAIMLFLIFLLAAARRRRMRRRFFQTTTDHTVKVSMAEDGLVVTTAVGASSLPWSSFERLWHGKSVVLLFYHGWQYLAFPTDSVPQAALDFASSKVGVKRNATGV